MVSSLPFLINGTRKIRSKHLFKSNEIVIWRGKKNYFIYVSTLDPNAFFCSVIKLLMKHRFIMRYTRYYIPPLHTSDICNIYTFLVNTKCNFVLYPDFLRQSVSKGSEENCSTYIGILFQIWILKSTSTCLKNFPKMPLNWIRFLKTTFA